MSSSKLTKSLAKLTKQLKWTDNKSIGFGQAHSHHKYLNPLLTPPPRSPASPDDFRHPERLGHWYSLGQNWYSPMVDKYKYHEYFFSFMLVMCGCTWLWFYAPDYKLRDWAKREAYLRTAKREALGLPLIDPYIVDPDRVHLPSEEDLKEMRITY